MASTMTIIVLCPYGRRQTVKASPNTSILEILEEACKKQGIKPEDYDISHYNKRLDLSLSVRFANLPNNALLELNPTKAVRQEGTVTVCLQLESGERLTECFPPSISLWDIIDKCLNSQDESHDEGKKGEPVCIYMRQQIVGENIKTTTLRNLGLTGGKAIIRLIYRQPEEINEQAHVSMPITKAIPFKDYPVSSSSSNHPSNKQMRLDNSYEESKQDQKCNEEIKIIQSNQVVHKSSHQSNPITTKTESLKLNEHYKQQIVDVNANGSTLQCENLQEGNNKEIGEIIYLGARNAVLFNLEDILEVRKADLPDDFFELTVTDVRYLMKELKNERQTLENTPLMLKSQREAQLLQQFHCYRQAVIRIYFPDKFVLQGTFIADETVQAVLDFVRSYLEDKSLDFYLYTTPPKIKLSADTTLLQARLVPAAVIYFGCNVRQDSYLHPHIKTKISDPRAATLEAAQCRKQKVLVAQTAMPVNNYEANELPVENMTHENIEHQRYIPPPSDTKAPKWFKIGKK